MCIIVAKERWADLPSMETLKTCWENNEDGAGIGWYDHQTKMARWEKGFMTFEAFQEFLEGLTETLDVRNTAMILHFRITSKGTTCPEQCHPFPVGAKPSYDFVKQLNGEAEMIFAHNGTMSSFTTKDGYSDTQTFGVDYLPYFFNSNRTFTKDKNILKIIDNIIGFSRLSFLIDNEITLVGNWYDDDAGVSYSNTGYIKNRWESYSYNYDKYTDYSHLSNVTLFNMVKRKLDAKEFTDIDVELLEEVEDRSYYCQSLTEDQFNLTQEFIMKYYSEIYEYGDNTK